MRMGLTLALVVGLSNAVQAQTLPIILVLGQGKVAFDQPATNLQEAQAYTYKAYVGGSTEPITVTATCAGQASPFTCTFPLSQLGLSLGIAQSLALTASVLAADGVAESAVVAAPFDLRLVGPPASPLLGSAKVQPGS